jgi:Na+-translocating ferredoxin:NAD+ oxidoreductase RNF subunit RnfB
MSEAIIYTLVVLVALGATAAFILYFVSKKFYVKEDPNREKVIDALPNTNCGGCGYPGCNAFADAVLTADDLKDLHCPVGGNEVMKAVAEILGKEVEERDPYVAVVRCSGSFEVRKQTNIYDGAPNCTVASELYSGDHGCAYGCVGLGECVDACDFDAMYMDEQTGLPVVIEDKCTACNACVTACPKDIIDLWPVGRKSQRIYVACKNEEKSGVARQECSVACTGCAKCLEECKYDAVVIENNLARIDFEKCTLCAKCVTVCDSRNIKADNVPTATIEKVIKMQQKKLEKEKKAKEEAREKARLEKEKAKSEKDAIS